MNYYKFGRGISLFYMHVLGRMKVFGRENIIADGPVVICANHSSMFDILLINAVFRRRIFFMAKQELYKIPVLKWFLKGYECVPVDRGNVSFTAMKQAFRILKGGNQLGIFPEGTRHSVGDGTDAKGGVAMFAYKCKAKILPIHLVYKRKFNLFNSYEVRIGKPIDYTDLGIEHGKSEEYLEAGERIMSGLYEL